MNKENEKTIYDLELHESLRLKKEATTVLRVEGGWLYRFHNSEGISQVVFVPYGASFKPKPVSDKESSTSRDWQ